MGFLQSIFALIKSVKNSGQSALVGGIMTSS